MPDKNIPKVFRLLLCDMSVENADIVGTLDGFYMVNKSLANILATKGVLDFLDSKGERLACRKFFDDWFLYTVPNDNDDTYSLLKLREQEHDTEDGSPADGVTPGGQYPLFHLKAKGCLIVLQILPMKTERN